MQDRFRNNGSSSSGPGARYAGRPVRGVWRVLATLVLAGLAASALWAQPPETKTVPFVILHTNDIHGQLRPYPDPRSRDANPRLVGGFQELVAAIDDERSKVTHSVLVDAGDWYQGTPEGTLSEGRCMVELMNAAGYDFAVIGNHDFDCGPFALLDLLRLARFRVFGRNIAYEAHQDLGTGPSECPLCIVPEAIALGATVDIEGFRVSFDGLICEEAPRIISAGSRAIFSFEPEIETAQRIRRRSAGDAFVLVNHIGKDRNLLIAREVPGFDVIIGGHAHGNVLEHGVTVPSTGTLIAQAASSTQALGIVTMEIDTKAMRVAKKSARLRRIEAIPDLRVPRIAPIIERYEKQVEERMNVPVAEVPSPLLKEGSLERASDLGKWLVAAMLAKSGADVAVHNTGGIRANLPAGTARIREFFQISPFGNRLSVVTLKGSDLRALAEQSAAGSARGCVFGGFEIHWERGSDGKASVVKLVRNGAEIAADAEVRVVTTDFLASAVEQMPPFKNATARVDLDVTLLDATIEFARGQKTVMAPEGNPWVRSGH